MSILLPLILLFAIGLGLYKKTDVFSVFTVGAEKGIRNLTKLLPTLCGLLCAVSMLRQSGGLEWMGEKLSPLLDCLGIPAEILPLFLLRPFSGSASLALASDVITSAGADSMPGLMAAVLLAASETTLYTLSVYGGAGKLGSCRRVLPAALLGDVTAMLLSVYTVKLFFG